MDTHQPLGKDATQAVVLEAIAKVAQLLILIVNYLGM